MGNKVELCFTKYKVSIGKSIFWLSNNDKQVSFLR